jgi:23S rRNA pseudouridine955/2504/2580 synthase
MEWITTEKEKGLLAWKFLLGRVPSAPPAYLRQLLRKGKVLRNGVILGEDSTIGCGERISLPASGRLQQLMADSAQRPVILLEGPEFLIVDKPAGLAVHRSLGHEQDHLAGRVQAWMRQQGHSFMTAPVHRLDLETSGPVLFAKGRRAAAALGKVFFDGQVEKIYLALVAGRLAGTGTLSSAVPAKGKMREASTSYQVLDGTADFCLLQVQLHSGRQHQIRRQLADLGHPVAGDDRYGGNSISGLNRLFLHCRRLALPNPFAAGLLAVDAPLPPDLETTLATLGIPCP